MSTWDKVSSQVSKKLEKKKLQRTGTISGDNEFEELEKSKMLAESKGLGEKRNSSQLRKLSSKKTGASTKQSQRNLLAKEEEIELQV